MSDRVAIGYEPRFDIDAAFGKQGELIVLDMLHSIVDGRIRCEVKRDRKFGDTGRLYVEREQNARNRGVWKPSGLMVSTAQAWAFLCNNDQGLFVVDTPWLRRAVEKAAEHQCNHVAERDGDNPTRGVCIQLNHFTLTRATS